MPQLIDVLAEVLRAHGYTATVDATVPGRKQGTQEIPLWIENDDRRVAVDLWLDAAPPGKDYLQGFLDQVDDVEAHAGLLVNLGEEPLDVPETEAGTVLAVWDRHHLQTVLGRAVLAETCPGLIPLDDPLATEALAAASLAPTSSAPPDEETDDADHEEAAGIFGLFDGVSTPTTDPAPAPASEAGRPEETPAPSEPAEPPQAPPTAARAPRDPAAVAGDFEELPGRADEPTEAEPAAAPPAPSGPSRPAEGDFEELPGRADEAPPPEAAQPTAQPPRQQAPVDGLFGALADRAAPDPPADAPKATPAAPAQTPAGDFEELPGRAESESEPEPQAPPKPAAPSADFEELPGRADEPTPPETAEAPAPTASKDFEELPGRSEQPSKPAPQPPQPASSGFEELPGRADHQPRPEPSTITPAPRVNPSDPAAALPTDPVVGNYQELPGRKAATAPGRPPVKAVDTGGRPGMDFEELPGRHDEPTDSEESAAPGADAGEFRMPLPFTTDEAEARPPPQGDQQGTSPATPTPGVLRMQVGPRLAVNMVKEKVRELRDQRLRLVPFLVYEYQADVLLDGKLDAVTKTGHVGVDAWMKRAYRWTQGFETAPLDAEGVEIEKRQIRVSEVDGKQLVVRHLEEIVGRDVTQEEDTDEWSVVVKKRVRFAGDDVRIRCLGTFWVPIWRLSGRDGAVEIDAATGEVLEEELLVEPSDSQLL